MGKYIDRIVLLAGALGMAFLFFYRCTGHLWLSLFGAFLLMLCLGRILSSPWQRFQKYKNGRQRARKLVDSWCCRPLTEGEREAREVVRQTLGSVGESVRVVFLPHHAGRMLNTEDVLARRRESDAPTLILCACPASSAARSVAEGCRPPVGILDRKQLIRLARRTELAAPSSVQIPAGRTAIWDRIRPGRCIPPALCMLAGYVYTGIWIYPLCAGTLLVLCALRLRRGKQTSVFFPQNP